MSKSYAAGQAFAKKVIAQKGKRTTTKRDVFAALRASGTSEPPPC
jgi:hypothetical protein